MHLPRGQWSLVNRFRSDAGPCRNSMNYITATAWVTSPRHSATAVNTKQWGIYCERVPVDLLWRRHLRTTSSTRCGLQLVAETILFEIVKTNDSNNIAVRGCDQLLLFVLVWRVCCHFENICQKIPSPKCDVIIQKCWLDAVRMPKMQKPQLLIFTGYKSISSWLLEEYYIAHSASRITLSCMTELKCCIFTFVCKTNHDWSKLYCVVWFQMKLSFSAKKLSILKYSHNKISTMGKLGDFWYFVSIDILDISRKNQLGTIFSGSNSNAPGVEWVSRGKNIWKLS